MSYATITFLNFPYLVALGMLHVVHLPGKTDGSEKLNARLVIIGPDDQGDGLQAVGDGFDVLFHVFSNLTLFRKGLPEPGSFDNFIETWILRLPVQNFLRFICASNKDGGITGASLRLNNFDGFASDSLN